MRPQVALEGPPRLAGWLIARVTPRSTREAIQGDLHERFARRVERDGARRARRWYWRQAMSFLWRVPAARLSGFVAGDMPTSGDRWYRDSGFLLDTRLAMRTLRRRPGLVLAATCILGLAVAASTAVLSVIDGVLLRPLPFPHADRLVMLWDRYAPEANMGDRSPITLRHYREWVDRTDLFDEVGAFESVSAAVVDGDFPERVDGALVTANLLPMLGARPYLGRLLRPEDEEPGAEPVILLGHSFWMARFGGDDSIVDRAIQVDGVMTRVVGVVAGDFWFYDPYATTRSVGGRNAESARLWRPLRRDGTFGGELDYPRYRVIARLRADVDIGSAAIAASAMRSELPPTTVDAAADVQLTPIREQIVAEVRPRLLGLGAAVALVLVIACVNLVSLLLVHLDVRRSELALRAALGAGRMRLARQVVLESALLSLGGGLLGLALSVPAIEWLLTFAPRGLPLAHRVGLSGGVALAGLALSLLCGALIGVVAAWRIDAGRGGTLLGSAPRTVAGSRSSRRLHGTLVGAEVALSMMLLIAATLLLRSFAGLRATDAGFRADDVLAFQASPAPLLSQERQQAFFTEFEQRLNELPGVLAAGSASALPFSRWSQRARITVAGSDPEQAPWIAHRTVSPGYFDAIGLRLQAGRPFETADRAGAPPVVLVNEAFVERWLQGAADILGRSITVQRQEPVHHTIVGVVADVKEYELFEQDQPIVYTPLAQTALPFRWFAVRTGPDAERIMIEPVRRLARDIEATQPLQEFIAFEDLVAQSMEEERFYSQLLAAFAAAALLLTLLGIYGVVAYTTRQRDREVGIRMALGAHTHSVHRLVVLQGLRPVMLGLVAGCVGAFATSGLLRGLVHGIPERDPTSYLAAALAFALIATAACYVPARRAARLDPVQVLRGE